MRRTIVGGVDFPRDKRVLNGRAPSAEGQRVWEELNGVNSASPALKTH